jgi:putative SOS response-associated peptidase YedK
LSLAFSDLWERWNGPNKTEEPCSIVTTEANKMMAGLHNRMPVTLNSEDFDWWMTDKTEVVGQLLVPCPSEVLKRIL